jgi:hypothetical protein
MSRLPRLVLIAVVGLAVTAPSAGAASDTSLGNKLGAMWGKILETPTPENPFAPRGPLRLKLPADNIFGAAAGNGPPGMPYLSVADGWVVLTGPLAPGRHTITLHVTGEFPPGTPIDVANTTILNVG